MLSRILKKIIGGCEYLKCLCLYFAAAAVSLFVKGKPFYKDLWLISERSTDARDNGYHFFKFLKENKKDINCAYLIDKASPDFKRVSSLGNTVQPKSFKHYIALCCAKAKISTHIMGYAPDFYRFTVLDKKFGLVKGKKVFLQHGIINNDIAEIRGSEVRLDLFICSTADEYKALSENYGYPDGVIRRLGLCRYDALSAPHEVKKQILVMPTWRYHLRVLSDEEFVESEYYKCFNGLISDKRLHGILEENGYELVFYLHYELQKFTRLFCGNNERVLIRSMRDADVQQLLMESAMLITDYSSVFFDFAYMKKPLAYWMFDSDVFYSEQYSKGYLLPDKDGFGPACSDKDDVIDYIGFQIKNKMALEDVYEQRINRTFVDFTDNHCEKTYEAIKELLKKGR